MWIPSEANIGKDASRYSDALKAYAISLPRTYGQDTVTFVYAHPSAELVEEISRPRIESSACVEFTEWPRSLKDIAARLGALAAKKIQESEQRD